MKQIRQEQLIPLPIDQVWEFFATPKNLNSVTPKELDFQITSVVPEKMYPGLIITYKIKPMLNIPLDWMTEITHIQAPNYFVDEQRMGPYHIWHHEHHFKEVQGGTLMTDILHYDIGKSVFGWLAGKLFVDKKVREIFSYRYQALEKHFNQKP
ncbi:MAG: SRPBCC family protein [Bacteroidia bacterium]|nr:SRPBCC family protein [Bacteroidia bacterium]